MVENGKVAYWQTVTYRLFPFVLTFAAFLSTSNWVPSITPYLNPSVIMYGWLFVVIGVFFLIEMGYSMPSGQRARVSAFLFAIMAAASFIMGSLIILGLNPTQNVYAFNIMIFLYGVATLIFIFHGSYELIYRKRLMLTVFR